MENQSNIQMETDLAGRLKNTPLPLSHALMPLFEAIVNSIHAIEEAGLSTTEGKIQIEIIRSNQLALPLLNGKKKKGPEPEHEITGFLITDNGVGFNEANFQSFTKYDSQHKAKLGCRGIGRLLWLKAFDTVHINSTFQNDNGTFTKRTFSFDRKSGVGSPKDEVISELQPKTVVELRALNSKYKNHMKKTAEAISKSIFEHCIWYYIRPSSAPSIEVVDGNDTINIDQIYQEYMNGASNSESITIKDASFDLIHIHAKTSLSSTHSISFCAANRVVKTENIGGKIAGLFGKISDNNGDFYHLCYISSEYLDSRVRPERTDFDIDFLDPDLFKDSEESISIDTIRKEVLAKIEEQLKPHIEASIAKGKEHLQTFVDSKAPKYKSIIPRIPEDKKIIDPKMTDRDLDLYLHKQLAEVEEQVLIEGHRIMRPSEEESEFEYQQRVQEYLSKAEDIKKSDLASYVAHRKVVLDLLEKAIERKPDGSYSREDMIHKLIMPMGVDSTSIKSDACNLWLVDERLAFHNYLASDKTLNSMPITDSKSTKEPDIVALNIFNNPILTSESTKLPLSSVVVIEIKRPMRNDMKDGEKHDPIAQATGYLDRIRNGKVTTANGRPIPSSDKIPGFCYILCDLTESMVTMTKRFDLKLTSDGLGYFGYNSNYNSYIEVISFDRLVNSAKERNRAFFDRLGLPTT